MTDEITTQEVDAQAAALKELSETALAMGYEVVSVKPLWKSKMLWVNVLAFASIALSALTEMTSEEVAAILGMGVTLVNIILRYSSKDISGVLK